MRSSIPPSLERSSNGFSPSGSTESVVRLEHEISLNLPKYIRGAARTVLTINIISQQLYVICRCCPSSYVGSVFRLHTVCVCFPSTRKLKR
jgi:hypothetical protein